MLLVKLCMQMLSLKKTLKRLVVIEDGASLVQKWDQLVVSRWERGGSYSYALTCYITVTVVSVTGCHRSVFDGLVRGGAVRIQLQRINFNIGNHSRFVVE